MQTCQNIKELYVLNSLLLPQTNYNSVFTLSDFYSLHTYQDIYTPCFYHLITYFKYLPLSWYSEKFLVLFNSYMLFILWMYLTGYLPMNI